MTTPPATHKLLARHLRDRIEGESRVTVYRDNAGKRPIPIGTFGSGNDRLHSTIGILDQNLPIPPGAYELAAMGSQTWLPQALASSIYWLKGRSIDAWPLICEDVVSDNVRSRYRHMAYIPSSHTLDVGAGVLVRWLLGIPITDQEIGLTQAEVSARAAKIYPPWLMHFT